MHITSFIPKMSFSHTCLHLNPEGLHRGTALNYTISSMAKSSGKTISKIAKQQEMIKKWNLNKNIQKELLKDLTVKKIKRNLKLNKKDFTSHFTKDITKYRKRKPKIILEKVQVSNQILAFLKFE